MKYQLIGKNDFIFDIKSTIFENRGIKEKEIEKFLNPNETSQIHFSKLKNIFKGVDLLIKHLKNGNKIHIVVDSDVDGYCSATILLLYLKEIYSKYDSHVTWNVHPRKAHGIFLKELEEFKDAKGQYQFDLLVVPDAGSDNFGEIDVLKKDNIDVLILDHHNIVKDSENAVIINPHLSQDYPHKEICGTTVVYKFLQALDEKLDLSYSKNFLDLVAIATIADMMDSRIPENRFYINKGLSNISNPFFKSLIKRQSFSMKETNIMGIAFYIAPPINAVNRVGTLEERKNLLRAMIDSEEQVWYKKRGQKDEVLVYLYEDMARQVINIKSRQNKMRDKIVPELLKQFNEDNVLNIMEISNDPDYKDMKGVLAMKIATQVNKPTLIFSTNEVNNNDETNIKYQGSARNFDNSFIKNLRQELLDSNLFDSALGHDNAMGFTISADKKQFITNYFNNKYSEDNNGFVYQVDFIMDAKDITFKLIKNFDKLKNVWGQYFREPKVLIKNIIAKNVTINEKGSLLSFKDKNAIEYKIFYPKEQVKNDLISDENFVKINVIGTLSINEWNNEKTHQVLIVDYEVVEKGILIKDVSKDDFFF